MLKNIIRLPLFATITYAFISCNSGEAKQDPVSKDIIALADSAAAADSAMPAGSVKADEYYANADGQEADSSFTNYPLDGFSENAASPKHPATILTTGQFHEDEVRKEDAGRSWYGIFQNSNGYYIDTTRIVTKKVQDPVDDEGTLNGWEVKTTNGDTSLLLFAGVNGLEKRQIKEVSLRKKEILPGESVTYTYNGITYTLYATGNKYKEKPESDYYIVNSYRLFIKATINGTERTQLLVSSRGFDDAMIDIIFAGDIDGDNIPDLIINTSYHYNATVPTLYLSKPADSKEVFKLMGWHVSVGC
jgi:hypothetical protein